MKGRTKIIGAASTAADTAVNSTTMVDADAMRGSPVMSEADTDPTFDVPAATAPSPPMPEQEGVVLCGL